MLAGTVVIAATLCSQGNGIRESHHCSRIQAFIRATTNSNRDRSSLGTVAGVSELVSLHMNLLPGSSAEGATPLGGSTCAGGTCGGLGVLCRRGGGSPRSSGPS